MGRKTEQPIPLVRPTKERAAIVQVLPDRWIRLVSGPHRAVVAKLLTRFRDQRYFIVEWRGDELETLDNALWRLREADWNVRGIQLRGTGM